MKEFTLECDRLTDKEYWENRWQRIRIPKEIRRDTKHQVNKELLKIFDAYLPHQQRPTILEIGGAPGQFLVYFAKQFGYLPHAIDYSTIGCEKMRQAFEIVNLDVTIYNRDIFSDLDSIVGKHVELLKKQGILLLGVPNYRGISQVVLKRLAPQKLSMHNPETMDIKNWESFEKRHGLETIFKAYIGGFNPGMYRRCENRTFKNQLIRFFFKCVRVLITDRLTFLRSFNSISWSAYLLGIYRKV